MSGPTLCVFAVWMFEPNTADHGRQARKHGHGDVLPEFGLASTPQHPKLPRLQQVLGRSYLLHGLQAQLRITRPATGCSVICCCVQPRRQSSAGPDISLLRPELQRQWHHAKNLHLGDRQITTGSALRVWWTCDKCPGGLPHEWLASVNDRQNRNSQCPYCTNYSLCQHNSLLTMAPAVAAYWDTAKNGLTPDLVMAGSKARRHWLCPKCGHSWQAPIHSKINGQSGCPKCSSISKPWNRQPSLTQSKHPAMLEFDSERNQRVGLDPDKITAGSNKMVHWICTKCPRALPHLFVATPRHRIGVNSGCPYCASRKACICNSLQSLYPAVAAEYDTARNGGGPEQVLPGSHKMAFWKDASGHTWEQSPFQRTSPERDRSKRAVQMHWFWLS
ncbi:TPA: hypothetical protein ACH3X2_001885 [Trebouxia sp. C0005]